MISRHTQSTEDLLPIGDAARLLGVSIETLRRWDRGGRISSVRTLGGHRRFRHGDIGYTAQANVAEYDPRHDKN